jgi:hypothetical protein
VDRWQSTGRRAQALHITLDEFEREIILLYSAEHTLHVESSQV